MEDMLTTDYDGCGRCLVGGRRLSRKTDKTSSPARQSDCEQPQPALYQRADQSGEYSNQLLCNRASQLDQLPRDRRWFEFRRA